MIALATMAQRPSTAAPPIEIIAEELGYYPVSTSPSGPITYSPARMKNQSTDQAVALAEHLRKKSAIFFGAYWCPHCMNQRAYFGGEALGKLRYVECASGGLDYDKKMCDKFKINETGFPTWRIDGKMYPGEMNLAKLAELSGFPVPFDAKLEEENERMIINSSGSCKM